MEAFFANIPEVAKNRTCRTDHEMGSQLDEAEEAVWNANSLEIVEMEWVPFDVVVGGAGGDDYERP